MKHKMLALILALTVVSWAQEATQTTPAAPQQSTTPEKAKCSCCDKMASADAKPGTLVLCAPRPLWVYSKKALHAALPRTASPAAPARMPSRA